MKAMRSIIILCAALCLIGCRTPKYGTEKQIALPGDKREVWAVAPALNLSGVSQVDPVIQAGESGAHRRWFGPPWTG